MQASELNYFKDILLSRKEQIEKNINGVSTELSEINASDLNDEGDHASANNNSMVESAIIEQQKKELSEIDKALSKITNGGYGICEMCEDDIGFQRLKVKPHAVYCIDCREIVEKSK
ncbi:RNA polymerase-binding protein DksA [Sulfurimonas autotrophica]|uniref:Transcriptional regulator, TraR/DksA family n=1 Tax=Sulfurimonas autotrophica (strain ATCC BAA-671 / DSM 16294 / JCM 11897 / OK10) TaxID=563040 RepID=E0USE0_SULAO|nr:RNA polymerase-binding protein DksA [Sulfurimonas autotrophica]ADN09103.1 transcriptional regulator, TraR/DksA family [Sulfurimonas autotrophica DSM 16294]